METFGIFQDKSALQRKIVLDYETRQIIIFPFPGEGDIDLKKKEEEDEEEEKSVKPLT